MPNINIVIELKTTKSSVSASLPLFEEFHSSLGQDSINRIALKPYNVKNISQICQIFVDVDL